MPKRQWGKGDMREKGSTHRTGRRIHIGSAGGVLAVAIFVFVLSIAMPAVGRKGSAKSPDAIAKQALKIAKQANRRAAAAVEKANSVPQGAKGDTGPPGLTASSFAVAANTDIAGSPTTVLALSSSNLKQLTSTADLLKMPFSGRVLASASGTIAKVSGSADTVSCTMQMQKAGGEWTDIGSTRLTVTGDFANLAVSGGFDAPTGDYNIQVVCSHSGSSAIQFQGGNLDTWAARSDQITLGTG